MDNKEKFPHCPQCGTPARVVLIKKASIRCALNADGTVGKVLSASRDSEASGYECGGGHKWEVPSS